MSIRTIFLIFWAAFAYGTSSDYPLDLKLDGPQGLYTDALLQLIKQWPEGRKFCQLKDEPLEIQMIKLPTEGRPYYVGFKKCMNIQAPLATVAGVMDDVEHYEQLYPGDKKVQILSRDRNKTTLAWERKIPVFFVPNEKYQMNYLSASSGPGIKMYRSQLKQGDRLRFSDAIVVIEASGPKSTLYTDYEFYEANYGIGLFGINAVSSESVWKESLEGSYLSLLAVRFKAEHLDWDYEHVAKASTEAFGKIDLKKNLTENFLSLSSVGKE